MARNDVQIKETGGLNSVPTDRWLVAAGTPITVKAGEPTKMSATAAETVILLEDADLTIATDQPMVGVAAVDSTETAAAAGYSDNYVPLPNIKWEMKGKVAAALDTQSEIDAFIGTLLLIDLTTTVFTLDTAAGTAATAAFLIVGGDPNRSTLHFRIRPDACAFGRASV